MEELNAVGWRISEVGVRELAESAAPALLQSKAKLEKFALDDLKDIGLSVLEEHLDRGAAKLSGPVVLQISRVRDVTIPKMKEELGLGDAGVVEKRLLRVYFTDGHAAVSAIDSGASVPSLSLSEPSSYPEQSLPSRTKTAPGTKVLLKGTIRLESGLLLLDGRNCSILGGRVDKLAHKFEVQQTFESKLRSRNAGIDGGPPKWVPFGKRIHGIKAGADRNFKSMGKGADGEEEAEETEEERRFAEERKAATTALAGGAKKFAATKAIIGEQLPTPRPAGSHPPREAKPRRTSEDEDGGGRRERRPPRGGEKAEVGSRNDDRDPNYAGRRGEEDKPAPATGNTLFDFLALKGGPELRNTGPSPPPRAPEPEPYNSYGCGGGGYVRTDSRRGGRADSRGGRGDGRGRGRGGRDDRGGGRGRGRGGGAGYGGERLEQPRYSSYDPGFRTSDRDFPGAPGQVAEEMGRLRVSAQPKAPPQPRQIPPAASGKPFLSQWRNGQACLAPAYGGKMFTAIVRGQSGDLVMVEFPDLGGEQAAIYSGVLVPLPDAQPPQPHPRSAESRGPLQQQRGSDGRPSGRGRASSNMGRGRSRGGRR